MTIHEDQHAAVSYALAQWGISFSPRAQTFTLLQKLRAVAEENGDRFTLVEAMDLRKER